ncbi:hypothetical protein RB653_008623 [Dictyostelium firmibasis]|uniref:Uncharacterized protein n=1 Tax=Dictyostelium firmibasis TaxID=79012 RepID=A0AAN7U0E4_9MYCE
MENNIKIISSCKCNTPMCPNTPIKRNINLSSSTTPILHNYKKPNVKFEDSEFFSIEIESLIVNSTCAADLFNKEYYNNRKSIWESQICIINERPSSLGIPLKF